MGDLYRETERASDGKIIELVRNYRSTPCVIDIANRWARRIGSVRGMSTPDMRHGNIERKDDDNSHVGCLSFSNEASECAWVAETVGKLVDGDGGRGAKHGSRGIGYGDIAILLRSSTSARAFMKALQRKNIPAVFRAGPDLFSQPEVVLFVAALLGAAGKNDIPGSQWNPKSLPRRIRETLGCDPTVEKTIKAAARRLKWEGLTVADDAEHRLITAVHLFRRRLAEGEHSPSAADVAILKSKRLRRSLMGHATARVFPQTIFMELANEFGISAFDDGSARGESAMFHLGTLSAIITGIESSGWTSTRAFGSKMIALALYGAKSGRTEEAPLLVQPDAVTIATIHAVKGLEFPAVFVSDVRALRFPSNRARTAAAPRSGLSVYPFGGAAAKIVNPVHHIDNQNYDAERRLMYVALTRAERFLFVTTSRPSLFIEK